MEWNYKDLQNWIESECNMEIGLKVTILEVSGQYLKLLPNEIGRLTNLIHFDCSNNSLTMLPDEIGRLTNLTYLDCSNNSLIMLSDNICRFSMLKDFSCANNLLLSLPNDLGLLTNLEWFYCDNNSFTSLPYSIGKLVNLKTLYCDKLTSFPQSITNLENLTKFGTFCDKYEENCVNQTTLTNFCKFYDQKKYNREKLFELYPPNIARFIIHIENKPFFKYFQYNKNNHNIQQHVKRSIQYILSLKNDFQPKQLYDHIRNNNYITNPLKNKLFHIVYEIANTDEVLLITYNELLCYVYTFICNHHNKIELFNIMNNKISHNKYKCFTKNTTDLINVLNGFDDNINVENNDYVYDIEQINDYDVAIKNKLIQNNKFADKIYKTELRKILTRFGHDAIIIDLWLKNV